MNRKLFLEVLPCSIDFSDFNALLIDIAFPITQKHEVVILERLRPTVIAPILDQEISILTLSKVGHRYSAFLGKALPVELYTLDFMKRICLKIAFATIRAGYNRHVLYNQHVLAFAVRPGNSAD